MRLLYLAHRVPDRPTKGDKIRAFHQLRALAARHEVHLFALSDEADIDPAPAWADEVASATVVPLGRWGARWRTGRALLAGGALTAAHFAAPELRARLAAAARDRPFDAAVVYSGAVDPLLEGRRPRVLDLVDVDSEKFRLYAERGTVTGPRRIACRIEARRLAALERHAVADADLTLVCTEDEAASLRAIAQPRRLEVVRNGVDLAAFPFGPAVARAPAELLFVGALDYQANVDAASALVLDLLPRVQARCPQAKAVLVGRAPTAAVRALAERPGVELAADVESVVPFLQRATLAVLPFRIARGIQNKALEALAAGLPLVATTESAKGLDGVAGRDFVVADGFAALAQAVVELLQSPAKRAALADAGRRLVERSAGWDAILARFVALVEEVAARGPAAAGIEATPVGSGR
ncbi:MAG: glycosyltransferase [Planctomycetes bacterium]|nr:glycosyltransferase [Planctomycetota bacterium]